MLVSRDGATAQDGCNVQVHGVLPSPYVRIKIFSVRISQHSGEVDRQFGDCQSTSKSLGFLFQTRS